MRIRSLWWGKRRDSLGIRNSTNDYIGYGVRKVFPMSLQLRASVFPIAYRPFLDGIDFFPQGFDPILLEYLLGLFQLVYAENYDSLSTDSA